MAHRSGILKRCGAIFFPGSYQFDSEPPEGTLRSSVVHSPGRASSNPLAWLASTLPGLFPHPPTRPASVVPLMTQARRGADYIGRRGRTPEISSRRSSARGPGAARPITQKRRTDRAHNAPVLDRAHNAPVLAVHVDDRPTPGVSIDTPLFLHPIASMQVCAAGVDRSYLVFLPLLSLLAIAGDTGGVEQIGQNQEPLGTFERPTQRG
jgi:hypothetical protein